MCAKFIGRRVPVGIGVEATRGTGVAPSFVLGKTNYTLDDKANVAKSGEGIGSISGMGTEAVITGKFAEGEIEAELGINSFGAILYAVFGTCNSAASGSAYDHTFTLAESNQHKTLSVALDDPNQDILFENVMIDTFELMVVQDEIVKWNAGVKSKASVDTTYTASPSADPKFVSRDLIVKVASDQASLDAASAICVKELTLTINKNADYDWCLGTLEPEDILNKQITIEGSITLNYEDDTWKDYMLGATERALRINLVQTRDTVGDQQAEFVIDLPIVNFSEWESDRSNDEIATQTVNFTAMYDVANNRLIANCVLTNTTASY